MIDGWTIAIYGTTLATLGAGNIPEPDVNSCVDLLAINSATPMTDNKWIKIDIIGWEIVNEPIEDLQTRIGGIQVHSSAQYRSHTIKLKTLNFPKEYWLKDKLERLFRKPDLFIYKGTYQYIDTLDVTKSFMPHEDGKCIKVAGGFSEEYKYDNGDFDMTLTFKNILPYYIDRSA